MNDNLTPHEMIEQAIAKKQAKQKRNLKKYITWRQYSPKCYYCRREVGHTKADHQRSIKTFKMTIPED